MQTKTIIITIVLLFSLTSFAQTKEETIAWIKEKLEQHGGGDSSSYSDVQVSPCRISFTEKYSGGREYKISFSPSKVKEWETIGLSAYILADDEIILSTNEMGEKENDRALWIRKGEPDILNQMIRQLTHLAAFCEEKKEALTN